MKKILLSSVVVLGLGLLSVGGAFATDTIDRTPDPTNQTSVPEPDTKIPTIAGKEPVVVMSTLACPKPKVLYCTRMNGYIFCYCF